MPLPPKHWRKIVIDGQEYRWHLESYSYWQGCRRDCEETFAPRRLLVQSLIPTSQRLVVQFDYEAFPQVNGQEQYPTPGRVAKIIRDAIQRGWHPQRENQEDEFVMDGREYIEPMDETLRNQQFWNQ